MSNTEQVLIALIVAVNDPFFETNEFERRQIINMYKKAKNFPQYVEKLARVLESDKKNINELIDAIIGKFKRNGRTAVEETMLNSDDADYSEDVEKLATELNSAITEKNLLLLQLNLQVKTAEKTLNAINAKIEEAEIGKLLADNIRLGEENVKLKRHNAVLERMIRENQEIRSTDVRQRELLAKISLLENQMKFTNREFFIS